MAVAKRQGREKTTKIEKKKIWGLEWGPQVEQTALLASTIYIGQAQGRRKKHIKRGAKGPGVSLPLSSALSHVGALSLSHTLLQGSALPLFFTSFGSACPNALRMYFPSFSKLNWAVTRSCNTDLSESCDSLSKGCKAGPSLQIFVVMRQNWGNYTLPLASKVRTTSMFYHIWRTKLLCHLIENFV